MTILRACLLGAGLVGLAGPVPSADAQDPLVTSRARGDDGAVVLTRLPARIVAPGLYRLERTLVAAEEPEPEQRDGIRIEADDVVLDLGGFALVGGAKSVTAIVFGAREPEERRAHTNVEIRNGTIRGWPGLAVDAADARRVRLADLTIVANGTIDEPFPAVRVGAEVRIARCRVYDSAWHGVETSSGAVVEACTTSDNGGAGLVVGDGSVVRDGVAARNELDGFRAIEGANGVRWIACAADANGNSGFRLGDAAYVEACSARGNEHSGFVLSSSSRLERCSSTANDAAGVYLSGAGNRVAGNHFASNGQVVASEVGGNVIVANTITGHPRAARAHALDVFPLHSAESEDERGFRAALSGPRASPPPADPWVNIEH